MYQRKEESSLGELFSELAGEFSTLIRQEVALARTEVTQKVSGTGKDVGFMAAGGLIAYAGLLALMAALIVGLAEAGLPLWASALIVGLVVTAIGYFVVRRSMDSLKRRELAPVQTIQSLKEDREWAKAQMK
jgi:hypothetical protein